MLLLLLCDYSVGSLRQTHVAVRECECVGKERMLVLKCSAYLIPLIHRRHIYPSVCVCVSERESNREFVSLVFFSPVNLPFRVPPSLFAYLPLRHGRRARFALFRGNCHQPIFPPLSFHACSCSLSLPPFFCFVPSLKLLRKSTWLTHPRTLPSPGLL